MVCSWGNNNKYMRYALSTQLYLFQAYEAFKMELLNARKKCFQNNDFKSILGNGNAQWELIKTL